MVAGKTDTSTLSIRFGFGAMGGASFISSLGPCYFPKQLLALGVLAGVVARSGVADSMASAPSKLL